MTFKHLLAAGAAFAATTSFLATAAQANVSTSGGTSFSDDAGTVDNYKLRPQRDYAQIDFEQPEASHFSGSMHARDLPATGNQAADRSLSMSSSVKFLPRAGGNFPNKLNQTYDSSMTETLFDTLQITGNRTASGKATMHMSMEFDIQQASRPEDSAGNVIKYPGGKYNILANNFAEITTSNAVIKGQTANDLTRTDYDYHVDNGGFSSANNDGVNGVNESIEYLDFTLVLNFDDPTAFAISLNDHIYGSMGESERSGLDWLSHDYSNLTLKFTGGFSVKGDKGEYLCGVSVGTITGESWGQTDACQGGGGDGGNGGGGTGSVPEPASWALMLGGFGLVGGAMRASRRKVVVAIH